MSRIGQKAIIVAVNIIVFFGLLAAIEAYFRLWGHEQDEATEEQVPQAFQPYVMFTTAEREHKWFTNKFTDKKFASSITTNSLGFNDRREFSATKPYKKQLGEKIVLFTGGSAAWGVGATATDRTIAGRMEYHLNALQHRYRYSVVNLGMSGWIGYQEFNGLQLWGTSFDPDWIVAMDGYNDATVGCWMSQGPGNPMFFAAMRPLVHGYPPLRGWLENELIKHSAAYRIITGKRYVPDSRIFDETYSMVRREIIPTKIGQSREMLEFYVEAESAMLKLFPTARYILSTQPAVNQFTGDFVDIYTYAAGSPEREAAIEKRTADLEEYLSKYEDVTCNSMTYPPSFAYIFGNGAVQVERLVERARTHGRPVEYYNIGTLFPDLRDERIPHFIDEVHLSDSGQDLVGKFYAEKILTAEAAEPVADAAGPELAAPKPTFHWLARSLADLQEVASLGNPDAAWDLLDGLNAEVIDNTSHVEGEPTLRVTATPGAGRHAIAVRFSGLAAGGIFGITAWVKGPPGARMMLEARDGADVQTKEQAHYGVARFDLASPSVVDATRDVHEAAIATDVDGWRKVQAAIASGDGVVYALIGMLDGANNNHIFNGSTKFELTLGGIEVVRLSPK
jgi:hypothetical protein